MFLKKELNLHAWLGTHEHENRSWHEGILKDIYRKQERLHDMREAHFHIKHQDQFSLHFKIISSLSEEFKFKTHQLLDRSQANRR